MNLIKARKIFFQEINYLVLITALYYGALRIHEADKNIIWHKLDTLALIAMFILPIPYMVYFLKFAWFLTKSENFTKTFELIKKWISKIKILSLQMLEKTRQATLLKTIMYRIFLTLLGIFVLMYIVYIYITLILLFTNIAKLLPH
ncbi:unnamed protein product [Commensalibacter communis]|uniref:Uncharacterized protein n=1 Tax=Commensalibacter communis TaxID=2972786 RepID=A0A9W4XAE0_9PROT|nr:hypothetical protein [Commensalibacter communis]CAI3953679.1 unnamed protein product [Commensalibacter communis]CAI3956509.1 unnamed protein product [Commensalibacter communis]CAI3956752.1 unnamed protein product [Commensalibacter communis]CAI3956903.1 unnamed protein product [Commensalibacter communis]